MKLPALTNVPSAGEIMSNAPAPQPADVVNEATGDAAVERLGQN